MNKIRFTANREANYVFHMLSVARCGYDNAYGASYRDLYPKQDLAVIKRNEKLLTVCGGQYCGELFWLLACEPACAKMCAKEYYAGLLETASCGELEKEYAPHAEIIRDVSKIMLRYYDDYAINIWPVEKAKIEEYIPQVREIFERNHFTEQAEKYVGCKLPSEYFTATLVSSVENGAEAIDISKEQDLFGIERDCMDSVFFIGHEFIIYLLFHALRKEDAFKRLETWPITEGLAEFYLKKIMGETRYFHDQQQYVRFFETCEKDGAHSAAELYRMALTLDIKSD